MNYTLMHRKIPVAEIEMFNETSTILKIGNVFAPEHMPIGINFENDKPNILDLNKWWSGRAIPASRQNIREAMENMSISSPNELISKCFGLSLSDQYWINPIKNPLEWDKINFFNNPFSEDVGNVLFGNPYNKEINLISPDNTSDGWLKKKWKIINGKRCLIKGGSMPYHQEPLNEACASVVMKRLNIPHASYHVIKENRLPYSVCECFINSETDLIAAHRISKVFKKENETSHYQHFLECCQKLNIPNAQENIDKMLILDYLIYNTDRHYNNFGAIRNAKTLEWTGIAPIFDNGTSLWHNQSNILFNPLEIEPVKINPFCKTHEEQIKLVKDFSWLDLSSLKGIENEFSKIFSNSPYILGSRINEICKAFKKRIMKLEQYIRSVEPNTNIQ